MRKMITKMLSYMQVGSTKRRIQAEMRGFGARFAGKSNKKHSTAAACRGFKVIYCFYLFIPFF